MGIFDFLRGKNPTERLLRVLKKEKKLTESQEEQLRASADELKVNESLHIVAALPNQMVHMDEGEIRPKDGRYQVLIDVRIIKNADYVKNTLLPRALLLATCDLIGQRFDIDALRIGPALPLPGKEQSHLHYALHVTNKVL